MTGRGKDWKLTVSTPQKKLLSPTYTVISKIAKVRTITHPTTIRFRHLDAPRRLVHRMSSSVSGNKQFHSLVLPHRCLKYDARVTALRAVLVQVAMIADLASQCRRKDVVQTNCMVALVNITSINGHEVRDMGQVVSLK